MGKAKETYRKLASAALAVLAALSIAAAPPAEQAEAAPAALAAASMSAPGGKAAIRKADVKLAKASYAFKGRAVKPKPAVTVAGKRLKAGRDYKLSYSRNKKVGTAKLTVTGKGGYKGRVTVKFRIGYDIAKAKVAKIAPRAYTGAAYSPKPAAAYGKRKLKAGRDYTLSYSGNVDAGTATVTLAGKGRYAGSKKARFSISRADISKATISPIAAQPFSGKYPQPSPSVALSGRRLAAGRDYSVSYDYSTWYVSDDGGSPATLTVSGRGNYRGSAKATFGIDVKLKKTKYTAYNNNIVCALNDDPETIYLSSKPPAVEFTDPVCWWDGKSYAKTVDRATGAVISQRKSISLISAPCVIDRSQYDDSITMPEGLAEAYWQAFGYTSEIRMHEVWISIFEDVRQYKTFGYDDSPVIQYAPEWFVDAITAIDERSTSIGNEAMYDCMLWVR